MSDLYQQDIVLWSERQAELLRQHAVSARANDTIDWPSIIEEIEAVGGSERAAPSNHIGTVIEHLLKLEVSQATEPCAGWRETVIRAHSQIAGQLEDTLSLRQKIESMINRQLLRQRRLVEDVLALYEDTPVVPPDGIQYSADQVLDPWLPTARATSA